jgi:hypothetical protein
MSTSQEKEYWHVGHRSNNRGELKMKFFAVTDLSLLLVVVLRLETCCRQMMLHCLGCHIGSGCEAKTPGRVRLFPHFTARADLVN